MSRPQWPYGTDSWQVLTISEKGGTGIATQKIESALIRVARSPTWITVVVEQVAVPAGEDVFDQAGSYSVAGGGVCGALAIEIAHAAVTFVPVFTPLSSPLPPSWRRLLSPPPQGVSRGRSAATPFFALDARVIRAGGVAFRALRAGRNRRQRDLMPAPLESTVSLRSATISCEYSRYL